MPGLRYNLTPEIRPSTAAWSALIGGIVLYDVTHPHDTMSRGYSEASRSHPKLVGAVTLAVVAHLQEWLPEPVDPFKLFLKHAQRL